MAGERQSLRPCLSQGRALAVVTSEGSLLQLAQIGRIVTSGQPDRCQISVRRNERGLVVLELRQQPHGLLLPSGIIEDQPFVGEDGGRFGIEILRFPDFLQCRIELADRHQERGVPVMGDRASWVERKRALELAPGACRVA